MATPRAGASVGSAVTALFQGSSFGSDSENPVNVLVVTKKDKSTNSLKSSNEDIETANRRSDNECARQLKLVTPKPADNEVRLKNKFFEEFKKNHVPSLILTITGDAKNTESEYTRCVQQFALHGAIYYLFNRKSDTGVERSWIVTGGTREGIMGACGKCYSSLKKIERVKGAHVTLLGIARSGPEDLQEQTALNSLKADADVLLKSPANYDPHHDFLILFDNGEPLVHGQQKRPWGTEIQFRRAFELQTARQTNPNASVVCMVFGGGKNTFATVLSCCRDKIPVLLIRDSGKVADILIDARTVMQDHPDPNDPYVFEWYCQRQEKLSRELGDMFTFERLIACCTSPLVEVFHPNFLVFARREFSRRHIKIDPKHEQDVQDLFEAGRKISSQGYDASKLTNIEGAFHEVFSRVTSRADGKNKNLFFEAEATFLRQILSVDQPGEEFKAFVAYLASTATNNSIVTDYGMMKKMNDMCRNVGDFWKYSSSWIPKRSLSSEPTPKEQFKYLLDSSWFGNIVSRGSGFSRDTAVIADQPFIANLSTNFSPKLFKMYAETKWKLPSPSILISLDGNLISETLKDDVKTFLRVGVLGLVNSFVSFNRIDLPWIFCQGNGELAELIGDSSLRSSNRVFAGKSIPIIGFSSAASLCTIKPVRYSSHPWEIHESDIWKFWTDPESAGAIIKFALTVFVLILGSGVEQPFKRIPISRLMCRCGHPIIRPEGPSASTAEDRCFSKLSPDGVIVGTYHRRCLPVDSTAIYRAFDDVIRMYFVFVHAREASDSVFQLSPAIGLTHQVFSLGPRHRETVESFIMQDYDSHRLSFLIGGSPGILPSLLQKLSPRSHLIVLSDSGGIASCIADCYSSMHFSSQDGPFKYTIEVQFDTTVDAQSIKFVLEGDFGSMLISNKVKSIVYSGSSRFFLGNNLLRCFALRSQQQNTPEVRIFKVIDHYSCRSYELPQTDQQRGYLKLIEPELYFAVSMSVKKFVNFDQDASRQVKLTIYFSNPSKEGTGDVQLKTIQFDLSLVKSILSSVCEQSEQPNKHEPVSHEPMSRTGFTILPQKIHPHDFVLEFQDDDRDLEKRILFEDMKKYGFYVLCSNYDFVCINEIRIHMGNYREFQGKHQSPSQRHHPRNASEDNISFTKFVCSAVKESARLINDDSNPKHRLKFTMPETRSDMKTRGLRSRVDPASLEMILKLASSEFVHVCKPRESNLQEIMNNIQRNFFSLSSKSENGIVKPLSVMNSKYVSVGSLGRHGLLGFTSSQQQPNLNTRPLACIVENESCNIEPLVTLLSHHGKPCVGLTPWEKNLEIAPNIVFSFAESHLQIATDERLLEFIFGGLLDSIPSCVGAWMLNTCASMSISDSLSHFLRDFERNAAETRNDGSKQQNDMNGRVKQQNDLQAVAQKRSSKLSSCGFFGLANLESTLAVLSKRLQNERWYDVFEESIFQVPLNNNNLFFGIEIQQESPGQQQIPYLPVSRRSDDKTSLFAPPLDAMIFVAHSEKLGVNIDYLDQPEVYSVSSFKSRLLSYLRDCLQACHVCVAVYFPPLNPDHQLAHDEALIDEVLFASQLNSGIVLVRSKDDQGSRGISQSQQPGDSVAINRQKLRNIFDILAFVFENPREVRTLDKPAPILWSKIEEICRNVSTKNPRQCLLKVVDAVENVEQVVSRLVVLQSVCHNCDKFNMIDDNKETSLMLAVCMGQEKEQLVEKLLKVSSLESILQSSENPKRFGQDAFLMALVANKRNMAKMILENLLQRAENGSLLFHDFSQMLCRVHYYIPSLFLLIRMGSSSEPMLDLILEIARRCSVRHSSLVNGSKHYTQTKHSTPGERGLMHIVSSLTDGFGCSALHHAIRSNCPQCVDWVLKVLHLHDSHHALNMNSELLSLLGTSFQEFTWKFWDIPDNSDDISNETEGDFLGSLLTASHVKKFWFEDLNTNPDIKTFNLESKSVSNLAHDILTMQNEISKLATLLYQIFDGISPEGRHVVLKRHDISHAYDILQKSFQNIEYDKYGFTIINSKSVSKEVSKEIFLGVFEFLGCNHEGVHWRLVLEMLACGVRSHCMKTTSLTEYELSSILLHYFEKLRHVDSEAEKKFQNQTRISRALIPDMKDQAVSGPVQHVCLKFSVERSLLLRKRISWPIMFSLAFIVVLSLATCMFVTSPTFGDAFVNVVQSLSGTQDFLSIKDLPDFQRWALLTFSPTLFELPGGSSLYSPISRWGSVRLRQLRVKPEPCKGFSHSWRSPCVPLKYDDGADTALFSFNYTVGGKVHSKSVPFNAVSQSDFNLLDLNSPSGGYDLFFGSSEQDQAFWNSLFSPDSTYLDSRTSAVFVVGTFYEPSVQKYVVAHFGLQFEPSKAILSAALLTDFFWDQSRRSGQSLSIDVLCSLMLGYFSWISFNCFLDIREVWCRRRSSSTKGFRGFGSLESLGRMKMTSARSTVFQAFFLTIFWAIAVIVGLFVWESRDLLSKIPKDDEFVNLLSISRYIYVMKSLLCFFVVVSYVHFLSLMREVPAIGGPVSAILYTIVDLKLLIFVILLFIFNTAISTAQFIGFRGDDSSLNTLQSVWFESMNALISGASLTSVQNHQYLGPSSSSYSGSGAFFMLTVVFGNILMMNLVISVLSERYEVAVQRYGTEAWNDDMSCRLGSYVLNSKLFLPSLRRRNDEFPNFDRFIQLCYCSFLVSSRTSFFKYLCYSFFLYPAYIVIEVAFGNPFSFFKLVHKPFPELHRALTIGKPVGKENK